MARPCHILIQTSELTSIDERAPHGSSVEFVQPCAAGDDVLQPGSDVRFHWIPHLSLPPHLGRSLGEPKRRWPHWLGLLPMHAVYADLDRGSCKTLRRGFR